MRMFRLAIAGLVLGSAMQVQAQDQQTLADIRQELTILYVEMQKLKREFSTTGGATSNLAAAGVLDRVSAIEAEMQRLTAQTERLEHRIEQIVTDGTNRIGDLEFRLCELEPDCDISGLGETSTLGGDIATLPAAPEEPEQTGTEAQQGELAVGEKADFEAAKSALSEQQFQEAANLFGAFNEAYPGSPLAAEANLSRGLALNGVGDTREAARAFLASFTTDANGPFAAQALVELGTALAGLGQTSQACVTLAEVGIRFPGAAEVARAQQEMAKLSCS